MTNLSDFLKCRKIKCICDTDDFNAGEIYPLAVEIRVTNNNHEGVCFSLDDFVAHFEPVIETAIQATDKLDDTPMGTRTITEFEVGDRVYFPAVSLKVITLPALQDGRFDVVSDCGSEASILPSGTYHNGNVAPYIVNATTENYEMLCKLYPHIKFEKPPVVLQGSDLARAKIKKDGQLLTCLVGNHGDKQAKERAIVTGLGGGGQFATDFGWFNNAVPIDSTGKPLTSEVLND